MDMLFLSTMTMIVALLFFLVGRHCGRNYMWKTLRALPIGKLLYCFGSIETKDGKCVCSIVEACELPEYLFVSMDVRPPNKFILLTEKGNVKVMEVP